MFGGEENEEGVECRRVKGWDQERKVGGVDDVVRQRVERRDVRTSRRAVSASRLNAPVVRAGGGEGRSRRGETTRYEVVLWLVQVQ